jgi:hypothetical protein
MPLAVVFDLPGVTGAQYDALMRALDARGVGAPDGRLWHLASCAGEGWLVVDVWESAEQLARFAPVLAATCRAAGIAVAPPRVYPVHNMLGVW